MKYRFGDRVMIRRDLQPDMVYGTLHAWGPMISLHAGDIVTIDCVNELRHTYTVKENQFFWSEEMLVACDSCDDTADFYAVDFNDYYRAFSKEDA